MQDGFEGLGFGMGKIPVGKVFGKREMDLRGWISGWGDPCGQRVQEKGLGRGSCGPAGMGIPQEFLGRGVFNPCTNSSPAVGLICCCPRVRGHCVTP